MHTHPSLVLASGSPRRIHLLRLLGLNPQIEASHFDEYAVDRRQFPNREEYVQAVAAGKVLEVADRLGPKLALGSIVLGGDLTTFLGEKIFHKPKSFDQAREFMHEFMGKEHEEIVALGIWSAEHGLQMGVTTSRVFVPKLSESELEEYLSLAEPLDKSGGHSVGALARTLARQNRHQEITVDGPLTGVLGFPVELAAELLETYGLVVPVNATQVEQETRHSVLFPDNT